VVAGHGDDLCAAVGEGQQRLDEDALRVCAGRGGIVQVAGDEDGVNLMLIGEADDLRQDGFLLVQAAVALEGFADMPVGGMQELHNAPPRVACRSCFRWCH
jgi:hypothetical protein